MYQGFPVAQTIHGASNIKVMGSIPRENNNWSNVNVYTECKFCYFG